MSDFIEGLNIFMKYKNPKTPFHAEHDIIWILEITPDEVSQEDKEKLEKLEFYHDSECFYYYT